MGNTDEKEMQQEEQRATGNGSKIAIAGAATLVAEPLLAMAHMGGVGVIAGFGVGALAWWLADEYEQAQGKEVVTLPSLPKHQRELGQPSLLSRMLTGRSVREARAALAATGELDGDDPYQATQYKGVAPSDVDDDDEMPPPSPVGANDRFTFSQMLTRFTPSMDQIFLGLLTDGTPVYVKAEDLCHVALAGNTGGGKSSLLRMIMAQLCYAGAHVLLLNPHYTPYDRKHDEDWTPYLPHLEKPADECARYENIRVYLQWMAETLLPRRIERVRAGKLAGRPYFVILDELPDVISEIKEAPKYIGDLLRQGRKYDIYLIVASQDFLASTVAGQEGGAIRKMYRTALYVGGDATTAKVLLDMPPKDIPESLLGKGTVMLRCVTTKKAVMARVPYLDNKALYTLLGESTFVIPDEDENDNLPVYTAENGKRADKQGVYDAVNEPDKPIESSGKVIQGPFINTSVNEGAHAQVERAPVSEDIRKHIRRMNEMKKFAHRDIAKVVGLYGPKYHIYRQVCAEEGIEIEKEASV